MVSLYTSPNHIVALIQSGWLLFRVHRFPKQFLHDGPHPISLLRTFPSITPFSQASVAVSIWRISTRSYPIYVLPMNEATALPLSDQQGPVKPQEGLIAIRLGLVDGPLAP